MKSTENLKWIPGLEDLTPESADATIGGESIWYWVGYSIGSAGYFFSHLSGAQTGGQRLMNAALG